MSKTITKVIAGIGIVAGIGVAALPLSSYADTEDVTISFKINPTVDLFSTCGSVNNGSGGISAGGISEVLCEVQYSVNSGATLSIVDKDTNTNLVGVTPANTIAALSTSANLASLSGGTEGWGYKFTGVTGITAAGAAANYNGVPTGTPTTVGSNSAPVMNAEGTFTFGVQTATNTEADTYSDTVTIALTPTT